MSVVLSTKHRWDTRAYRRMVAVSYRAPYLVVGFDDGAEVAVEVARFDNPAFLAQRPDWPRVYLEPDHIVVPTVADDEGIPWTAIRCLTDPEFAAWWAEQALASARRVGVRLRALRGEQDWSEGEMAAHAGVPLQIIEDIEAGRHPLDLRLHDRLLKAMGLDARALIVDQDEAR